MMPNFNDVCRLPVFNRDLKKLLRKFRTLEQDFETFIESGLYPYHKLDQAYDGIVEIPGLRIGSPAIYKAIKFACRSLPGKGVKSGIRIVYAYFEDEDRLEFIEIYYKGDKENEDRGRIKKYYPKKI